jgi:hypothetical protein
MGQLNLGIIFFKDHGFNVIGGDNVFSTTLGYAATPQEKAYDINRMFINPSMLLYVHKEGIPLIPASHIWIGKLSTTTPKYLWD